jgi:hypothetical protein
MDFTDRTADSRIRRIVGFSGARRASDVGLAGGIRAAEP